MKQIKAWLYNCVFTETLLRVLKVTILWLFRLVVSFIFTTAGNTMDTPSVVYISCFYWCSAWFASWLWI